jgi:hypothetical protein
MDGRTFARSHVHHVDVSFKRNLVLGYGALGVFGFDDGGPPALVYAHRASDEGKVQTRYGAVRQMDAAGFSITQWPD